MSDKWTNAATKSVNEWLSLSPHVAGIVKSTCKSSNDYRRLCEKMWGNGTLDFHKLDDVNWEEIKNYWKNKK